VKIDYLKVTSFKFTSIKKLIKKIFEDFSINYGNIEKISDFESLQ